MLGKDLVWGFRLKQVTAAGGGGGWGGGGGGYLEASALTGTGLLLNGGDLENLIFDRILREELMRRKAQRVGRDGIEWGKGLTLGKK